jgi:hypothetical protein
MAWRRALIVGAAIAAALAGAVSARDDGRFAGQPLRSWFNNLSSGKGLCCSFADGQSIADVDWDTAAVAGADGNAVVRYRVRIDGQWVTVPPEALVNEPNRYGPAVVWPYNDVTTGKIQIRCFMPSSMS